MTRQLIRFVIIGAAASLVHLAVVWYLVDQWAIKELVANVIAYIIAVQVSFWGHHSWSFSGHGGGKRKSMAKFISVSLSGLALNQLSFYLLLKFTPLDYRVALVLVLGFVAVFTFVFSKLWAFKHKKI